jgi:poly(hydroxyalkanoate) synthase III subunit E
METPFSKTGFKPDAAFASAAERFYELLKTFGASGQGGAQDWAALGAPLAGQFEQWLRLWQSGGPWPGGTAAPVAGFATAPPAWPFRPLPLGPAAALAEGERMAELFGRLAQLQTQLATHWSEIANAASRCFMQRVASAPAAPPSLEQAMKLYELWVSCAEEAYAATVHRPEFARLQAEITNTSAALLIEQRRQLEALARAAGLPTREEVDALYGQLRELRRELAGLATQGSPETQPAASTTRARGAAAAQPAPDRRPTRTRAGTPRASADSRKPQSRTPHPPKPRRRRPRH